MAYSRLKPVVVCSRGLPMKSQPDLKTGKGQFKLDSAFYRAFQNTDAFVAAIRRVADQHAFSFLIIGVDFMRTEVVAFPAVLAQVVIYLDRHVTQYLLTA
jgi:hypothetical protein